jgi:hypothetical protein
MLGCINSSRKGLSPSPEGVGEAVEGGRPCHTPVESKSEPGRGGGSGRGDETMPHTSRRRRAVGQPQWHRQRDSDDKDVDTRQSLKGTRGNEG